MNNIMLDLETVGTKSNAPIIAIGAVAFDMKEQKLGEEFYMVVDLQSAVDGGAVIDPKTFIWWMQQSYEARAAFNRPGSRLSIALLAFDTYVDQVCGRKNAQIWGNGSDFDNVILREAYARLKMVEPWEFWNNRCYRTMKNIYPNVPLERTGIAHNALHDAKTQAEHLMRMLG